MRLDQATDQVPTPVLTTVVASTAASTPTSHPPCAETRGQIVLDSFPSRVAGREFHYRVYLPPCYGTSGKRYPYLIMMHGLVPGSDIMNDSQWDDLGLDEQADAGYLAGIRAPMIIVMPNGNDVNHGNDDSPFVSLLVNELIPEVEGKYCTWNEPASRAIGGLSRGGFWALSTAFLNPQLFERVGGHSPFLYDGDYPVYNPYNLADQVPGIERLTLYIDHGAQDYVQDGVQLFVEKLSRRGIVPTYIINPEGAHTEDYWAAHTADYLDFYAAGWPLDLNALPDCEG